MEIIIKNSTGITIKNNKITCECGHTSVDEMKCPKCKKDLIVITNGVKK
jgi:hypothetical protein